MNIRSNIVSSHLLSSLYQGQVAMHTRRLNRSQFPLPTNNAPWSGSQGVGTANFVTNIRSAASTITQALDDLSGPAFGQTVDEYQSGYSRNAGAMAYSASTRTVAISSRITATLNTAEDNVEGQADISRASSAVERLAASYNSLNAEAAGRSNGSGSPTLQIRMVNISRTFASALSNLGIGLDNNGNMRIAADRLNEAEQDGSLEEFFSQSSASNFSFTSQLDRLSYDVNSNSGGYVPSTTFRADTSRNFVYSSTGSPVQFNTLTPGSLVDFML